jgi:hypothetical protein
MMKAVIVTMFVLALGVSSAHAEDVYQLAYHPQCSIVGTQVMMRGAVVMIDTHQPVERARVTVHYAGRSIHAWTNSHGIWTAQAPVDPTGGDVVEDRRVMIPVLGDLVPATAEQSFSASCHPAVVQVGAIEQR